MRLAGGVYAEAGLTQGSLTAAFGALHATAPLTLFCHWAACQIAFGGPPQSASATDLGFACDGVQTTRGFLRIPTLM